ncbi:hypothetical protein FTUN_3925 [Frigoriglobus tundricola]|uniref:Uncharacterized protein n=1 Tax=Frigoriglobus tundricola TaxID=2774151 RepID=A0A6M5YQZ3_9BACT|nr:hypothetical protein FTUN_3925 [Frigoriglobus tundricola]
MERTNRRFRYLEKVRYKWRRRRTIVRFIILVLDRWHSQRTAQDQNPTRDRKVHAQAITKLTC